MSTQQQRSTLRAAIEARLAEPNFYRWDLASVLVEVLEAHPPNGVGRLIGELEWEARRRATFACGHAVPLLEPFRKDKRYCSAMCRQRAHRDPE